MAAKAGRYEYLRLDRRAKGAALPNVHLLNLRDPQNQLSPGDKVKPGLKISLSKSVVTAIQKNLDEVAKCMTCGCDDLGNDHHYISDTEKCLSCFSKGQGPCWDGYEYIGTKEQDGKTVPNCVPAGKKKV